MSKVTFANLVFGSAGTIFSLSNINTIAGIAAGFGTAALMFTQLYYKIKAERSNKQTKNKHHETDKKHRNCNC